VKTPQKYVLGLVLGPVCWAAMATIPAKRARALNPGQDGAPDPPQIHFVDIAQRAGLTAKVVYGGEHSRKYIIESTGGGVAVLDYDNDGWPDIFLLNGTTLDGFPKGDEPTAHLYHNNHNGTFTDVTQNAGLKLTGWQQGVCAGDYDNDGWTDLFVTAWGHNILLHNNGDGTFTDATKRAGIWHDDWRWGTGCAFLDYDRDGRLDLFVANYVDFPARAARNDTIASACDWMGVKVFCGPRGMKGSPAELYRNDGDGTFTNVSGKAGIAAAGGHSCFSALPGDFDDDGWPDVYVACDSTASLLFHNNGKGGFTEEGLSAGVAYNEDGKLQSGMGADAGDYLGNGRLDIVKTNFSDDIPTLDLNNGDGTFSDVAVQAGLESNLHRLGWGALFTDVDDDGWPDIFLANGHVYPEIDGKGLDTSFREPRSLYWNEHNGRFKDLSMESGPGVSAAYNSHGLAAADFNNDGATELLVSNTFDAPSLLRDDRPRGNWLLLKLIGTRSNRSAIGARVTVRAAGHEQTQEVRSGGSYISQSDFRLHFGLGAAGQADSIAIRWPSGGVQKIENVAANQILTIREGSGVGNSARYLSQRFRKFTVRVQASAASWGR